MPWRLLVIDGADQGRFFPLADSGAIAVGNSRKHADVCLNDLYVSRVHCHLCVSDGQVSVSHVADSGETMVNGKPVTNQPLKAGDVVRVGNSHLRLEEAQPGDTAPIVAARAAAGKLPTVSADRLDELADHVLGHFELGTVLGRSHSGIVFQAHNVKNDQTVALKVMSPEFGKTAAEMQNFAKAMKTALPLRHPSLVAVLGAGKTGPYTWIAREFVDGESAEQIIAREHNARRIEWRCGFHVAYQIGRALEFLHGRHLMHANVTPRNVLYQASTHCAKLADLMLNKALQGSALQQQTLEPKFLVELPFLAPEQLETGAFVDNLCDIYGLGAVVYALLTGRPPFAGEAPDEVIGKIRSEPPEHPRIYQRTIPVALDRMVMKMLAKQQMDRYASPTQLLEELEQLAEEQDEPLGESTLK